MTGGIFFDILYKLAREGDRKGAGGRRAKPNLENDTERETRKERRNPREEPRGRRNRKGKRGLRGIPREKETAKIPKSLASRDVKD